MQISLKVPTTLVEALHPSSVPACTTSVTTSWTRLSLHLETGCHLTSACEEDQSGRLQTRRPLSGAMSDYMSGLMVLHAESGLGRHMPTN